MNKFVALIFVMFLFTSPVFCLEYDYTSVKNIPIKLSILEEISTKMPINEGQIVKFRVLNDVVYSKLNLKKNDIVEAKIECIVTSGMNGFPAEIIIDNFEIPNVEKSQLISTYTKIGQNRCIWVYPLKWALTPFPPTGSITNIIKGGHAKIKTSDVITLYYYPEWK
jgi:hypothetical protein